MERGKRVFTKEEIEELKKLIAQLEEADSKTQKGLRAKLRRIGLYWQEVGQRMPYTVENFQHLLNLGVLRMDTINKPDVTYSATMARHQPAPKSRDGKSNSRVNSDEYYVIDLCDEVLGEKASRQAKFGFLKGDTGRELPVDAYYPQKKLVVEYYERQHTESVNFFDKKMTASGVTRDVQRRIYDERRKTVIPENGLELVVISYSDFGTSKKLKRDRKKDLEVVRRILKKFISETPS